MVIQNLIKAFCICVFILNIVEYFQSEPLPWLIACIK